MTIASFLSRRRRMLAVCAASALLHYFAIGWVGARISAGPERDESVAPAPIVAALRAAAPTAPAAAPAPPKRTAPKKAAPADAPPMALAETSAADLMPTVESAPLAALAALPEVKPEPEPVAEPAPAPVTAQYKVSLPPSAELMLDVARTDANGTKWTGQMAMSWQRGASSYSMTVEASISMLVTRVSLLRLTSEGELGETGIAPRTMTEKRRGKAQTATHFNTQEGRITFSASERNTPLLPGAQDRATAQMQLAAIGRADSAQLARGVEMLVGEDKDAVLYSFVLVGQEEIDTGLGKLATWRMTRPPRPGAYNSRLDIWLSPAHNWYPVQTRSTEANGAVTTQTISKIVVTESGT